MKAITTRSGVAYEGPSIPTNPSPKKVVERETEETTDKEQTNFQGSTAHIPPPVNPIPILEPDVQKTLPKPNIPYPSKHNDQKSPFAPMIRNLLMNKEKLLELAKIQLNENCSAMLLKKLPEKLGDPDKFLIPCNFPGMDVCHALADLGASINLMPLSIWKKLSLPELTPTRMTLELADRSITHPKGCVEDVFVKVRKFHFPTGFVVVDFEVDPRVPLILGRSFLRTSRALIDVYEGELIYVFSLLEMISPPHDSADEIITNPSRIAREHEEYISLMWLLCGNSSSQPSENFHASPNTIIESLPIFPIPVQDSDSHREEIDIFPGPDDLIPPEIERDDYDSEDDENSTVDEPVLLHITRTFPR
ncbi:reverse transcriptase domain-containing protein [Tanacetum coccineum]